MRTARRRRRPGVVRFILELLTGLSVAAIVTHQSSEALGLAPGKAATAIFKASSVIIGVPA